MSNDRIERGGPADDREPSAGSVDDRNPQDTTASRLFDLRTIIGALFVLYGVILFIAGLFDSSAEIDKAERDPHQPLAGAGDVRCSARCSCCGCGCGRCTSSTGPSAAEQAGISDGPPG